jgi:hypothetical protein
MVALLMGLAVVVSALAAKLSPAVRTHAHTLLTGIRSGDAKASNTDAKKSGTDQADEDQCDPSEDSSKSSSSGQVLEEEHGHKAMHFIGLTYSANHGLGFWNERIDRAYEAWFYVTAHPPLTPPPNVA